MEKEEGEFLRHVGCFKCSSGDALSLYQKLDGTVDGFCFSCHQYHTPDDVKEYAHITQEKVTKQNMITQEELEEVQSKNICGWKERRIPKSTCEKYGVYSEGNSDNPIKRFYPITIDDELKGFKIRFCESKDFGKVGYGKANSDMFGQSLFPSGGKFLCITEGEEDCMALYTALNPQGGKYQTPVISPTAGAGSVEKQVKRNYEYITSFDKVIFFMDNDEVGKEAAEKACRLLPPGKAYTTNMKLKSPDEYTRRGRGGELVKMFWDAERYSPVDVSTFNQMWEDFENSANDEIIPMPECMGDLAYMLGGGPAAGEVTVMGAHTSIGKTSFLYTWLYFLVTETDKKVGTLFLEGSPREFVRITLSIHKHENLALKSVDDLDMDELRREYHEINPDDSRLLNVNHNGSFKSSDELLDKVRWMIKVGGCDVVFIDPLQAAVPNNENGTIDAFMDACLKLAKETNVSIVIVSHTKKPSETDPHKVSEYDLKGSGSINQIAFNTFLISRDKLGETSAIKNSTKVTLVKARRTSMTGDAGWLSFNPLSYQFSKGSNPYVDQEGYINPDEGFEVEASEEVGTHDEGIPWDT